jgi:hypothetical protein
MPKKFPFSEAMLVALAGVLAVAFAASIAIDYVQRAAEEWYAQNKRAQIAERPWFVRFYEFLNQ